MSKFRWVTMAGEILTPPEMETTHLFYVIRMVYNHTVPPALRLPGGHWEEPEHWTPETKRRILIEMIKELAKRNDLPFALVVQLGIMRERFALMARANLANLEKARAAKARRAERLAARRIAAAERRLFPKPRSSPSDQWEAS